MIKEIKELENYAIKHKYRLGELLDIMQIAYTNNGICVLTHDKLEMILNYVCLLQKYCIKYTDLKLKNNNKRSKKWKR